MTHLKSTIAIAMAIFTSVVTPDPASARQVEIKLMQTTDVHGSYFPTDFITRKSASGSLARVASVVAAERSRIGRNAILIDNGDILQGQPSAYFYNYVDTVSPHLTAEILNYMGYDLANVGNHDVETGITTLMRWADDCKMPVLGANIIDTATGQPRFKPYEVIERDGIKIAILGMITPAIPAWLPQKLWKGLRFDDMLTTARKWMPIIKERERPDAIIGLFHAGQDGNLMLGYKENASLEVATEVAGFDAVFMGHDHQLELKSIVNTAGDTVVIINPANNARHLGELTMKFDVLTDATGGLRRVVGKHAFGALIDMDSIAPAPDFIARFAPQINRVEAYVGERLGEFSQSVTTRDAYFGPSEFVDLIHELQLSISGAEISFAAPLSFDATIPAGPITMADLFNLYKYENMLYVMELTGREIKGYLEESYDKWVNTMTAPTDHLLQMRTTELPGERGRGVLTNRSYNFDSAAGIIYEVDVTKPRGQKIKIISMADGSKFDPERTYRVALNSYRGNGGGELLTDGAGIAQDKLSDRIVFTTDRDLRYYLAAEIRRQGIVKPRRLNHWRFVPEALTAPAARRDRDLLFSRP